MAKVFITKYALTKGIIEKEADIHSFRDGSKFAYIRGELFIGYKMTVDAFYDYESAIQKAEKNEREKNSVFEKTDRKVGKIII